MMPILMMQNIQHWYIFSSLNKINQKIQIASQQSQISPSQLQHQQPSNQSIIQASHLPIHQQPIPTHKMHPYPTTHSQPPSQPQSCLSTLRQKTTSFRKQIRSQKLTQYFTSQRKTLLRQQLTQLHASTDFPRLSTWDDVREQLSDTFLPNYQAVHLFVRSHLGEEIPEDVERVAVAVCQKGEVLRDQNGLVLISTLANVKKKDGKAVFDSDVIRNMVESILKENAVVVIEQGREVHRWHYYDTVCWTLFSLAVICEQNKQQTFSPLTHYMPSFQTQSSPPTLQLLALLSQLSTCPTLLPSIHFILSLLLPIHPHSKKLTPFLMKLLDNFIRFHEEENQELAVRFVDFMSLRLQEFTFPAVHKLQLVALFTALVKSWAGTPLLEKMFHAKESNTLCQWIFYMAGMEEWEMKNACLTCMCEMLCQQRILPHLTQYLTPEAISHLIFSSLLLHDNSIKLYLICTILSLIECQPSLYLREFRKFNFPKIIREYENDEQDKGETFGTGYSLSEMLVMVYETKFEEKGGVGGGSWGEREI